MNRDNLTTAMGYCDSCGRHDGMTTGGCIHCLNRSRDFNPYSIYPELFTTIRPPFYVSGNSDLDEVK